MRLALKVVVQNYGDFVDVILFYNEEPSALRCKTMLIALLPLYRGADKSLARTGRKQARKHVRDARDFNNIETRAIIKFFFSARQVADGKSRHSDRNISLFPSWSG